MKVCNRFCSLAAVAALSTLFGCWGQGADQPVDVSTVSQYAGNQPVLPDRTLFVATSWSGMTNPNVHFTTISDALIRAAAMSPTLVSPVGLIVFPGRYPQALTLVSHANITGTSPSGVTIDGSVTYTPGVGVNAPVGADHEVVNLMALNINGAISYDATGKSASTTAFVFRDCPHGLNGVTAAGRSATGPNRDLISFFDSNGGAGPLTFTNLQVSMNSPRTHGMTFNGASLFNLAGGDYSPSVVDTTYVNGTSSGTVSIPSIPSPWVLNDSASVTFSGATFTGASTLTVASGATADVRGAQCDQSRISGAGVVSRRSIRMMVGPTSLGANPVTFATPLPDGLYSVSLVLTGGLGGPPTVSAKAGAGFTVNDPAGGNTYEAQVSHD